MSAEPIDPYDPRVPRSHERDAAEQAERQRLQEQREQRAEEREYRREKDTERDLQPSNKPAEGGGNRKSKGGKTKKRGTKLCPTCHIESCDHMPKRGRPNKDPQEVKVHAPSPRVESWKIRVIKDYGLDIKALYADAIDHAARALKRAEDGDAKPATND